jgi:hypothetical protein
VSGLQENVARLKNDAHAALPETSFEQVTSVKCRITQKRRCSGFTILWTVIDIVRKTPSALWTLFHLLVTTGYTD